MIKAGLIGGRLSHSYSPQIHQKYWHLTGQQGRYSLLETAASQLGAQLSALAGKGYTGVNVTIPHKTAVMRYLDIISPEADAIGSVNTIHFSDGRLIGHNTDYFGLQSMLARHGITLAQKTVVILGSGGAARCAFRLAIDEGARQIIVASRQPNLAEELFEAVSYDTLDHIKAIDVLINTTPAGMYPHTDACPVSDNVIEKCAAVADLIYNPEKTVLLKNAAALGKECAGGLWMLCAQALAAQQIWTGRPFDEALCATIYGTLREPTKRTNTVLIGMPGSGKSTIGKMLARQLSHAFLDTDALVESAHGRIQDIFSQQGEAAFRLLELQAARQAAAHTDTVISTGGGIIQTEDAIEALKQSGIVVYIDRPLELLLEEVDTTHRPLLAGGRQRLIGLYSKRRALYHKYADITVQNAADAQSCAAQIFEKRKELI